MAKRIKMRIDTGIVSEQYVYEVPAGPDKKGRPRFRTEAEREAHQAAIQRRHRMRKEVGIPKLLKGRRAVIHTGRGSDTLDHAELLRSILAMKYPNEAVRPTFCIRCLRDLPEGRLLCAWCGHWNGEVRPEPMYKGSLMGDF